MHQLFVTMAQAHRGRGIAAILTFPFAWVYAQHCGDIFMVKALPKALPKSWQVNVKLTQAGLSMELKVPRFHGTAGTMLRSKHGT